MRHIHRIQITDGYLRGGRVEKELMFREGDRFLGRVYDSLGACLQGRFKLHTNGQIMIMRRAFKIRTRGIISAGSLVNLCANSSL